MIGWEELSIAELCIRTTSGGTPSRSHPEYFRDPPGGIPWVRSQELTDRRIKSVGEHITPAGLKNSSAKLLQPGSVLLAMYGATVGQLGYLDIEAACNQAVCCLTADPERANARFLFYALMNARSRLVAHAHGAAQQNLSQALIRRFALEVPPPALQRRIAGILGALDDLIEANRRRIALLETMAEAIYREWFVRFRYPGHEDATLVDSPAGPIPKGWSAAPLSELAALDSDTISPAKSPDESFNHYSIPAFDEDGLPREEAGAAIKSNKFVVRERAILVSKLNPRIERVWFVTPESPRRSLASTEFLVMRPESGVSHEYLYLMLRASQFQERLRSLAVGTSGSHQRAKPSDVMRLLVPLPPAHLVRAFTATVGPSISLAELLRPQTRHVRRLRDLLLPRLVSGQIDVSHFDLDELVGSHA